MLHEIKGTMCRLYRVAEASIVERTIRKACRVFE